MLLSDRELKGVAPRDDHPSPADILSGDPACRFWEVDTGSGRRVGIRESRPGSWRVRGAAQEFTYILSGRAILRPEGGRALHLGPGDSLTLRRGFRGVWEVVETLRREFITGMR